MIFRKKFILLLFATLSIQSCAIPGMNIESIQVAQLPHNKNSLQSYRRGIVVFKGISCPKNKNEKIEEESAIKNFISNVRSAVNCSDKTYSFRSADNDQYYSSSCAIPLLLQPDPLLPMNIIQFRRGNIITLSSQIKL